MDELNSRDLHSINRVVTQALTETKLNKLWHYLHTEYGIGRKNGNYLQLTSKDHQRVREITHNNTRLDPMLPLPSGSRMAVSKYSGNEKLGSEAPGRHHLLLNSPNGLLQLNSIETPLTLGSSYRCDWRELDLSVVKTVIVVENMQAFDYIQQARLPQPLAEAWVLYRGHDVSSQATIDLLNALTDDTCIIGFFDYDPAGFKILLTMPRMTHCLLPELSENLFNLASGTRNRFYDQQSEIDYVENTVLSTNLHQHWQQLMQHKVCVAQELMLAMFIKLECYPTAKKT
jgi:hypothetical protein